MSPAMIFYAGHSPGLKTADLSFMQTCTKKPSVFLDISSTFIGILNIEETKRYFWLEKILVIYGRDTEYEYGLKTKYTLNPTYSPGRRKIREKVHGRYFIFTTSLT